MCNTLHEEIRENITMEVNRLQEAIAQVKEETLEKVDMLETRVSVLDEGNTETQTVITSLKEDVSTIRTDVNQALEGITKSKSHYDNMFERVARRLTNLEAVPSPTRKGLPSQEDSSPIVTGAVPAPTVGDGLPVPDNDSV